MNWNKWLPTDLKYIFVLVVIRLKNAKKTKQNKTTLQQSCTVMLFWRYHQFAFSSDQFVSPVRRVRLSSSKVYTESTERLRGFEVCSTKIGSTSNCCANTLWVHTFYYPDNHYCQKIRLLSIWVQTGRLYTVIHHTWETRSPNMASPLQAPASWE